MSLLIARFSRLLNKECTKLKQQVYDGRLENSFSFSCAGEHVCDVLTPLAIFNAPAPVMFFILEFSNLGISRR